MVHGFLGVFAENFLVKANRIEPNGNFQIRMGTFKSIKITINNSQRWVLTKYAFFVFYTKIEVFRPDEQLLVVKCFQIQFLSWYAKIPTYSLSCRWVMYGGLLISWAPRREPRHHHQPFKISTRRTEMSTDPQATRTFLIISICNYTRDNLGFKSKILTSNFSRNLEKS